ncbi:unnamed protein product, partial [marine sediment metagenome]
RKYTPHTHPYETPIRADRETVNNIRVNIIS